MSFAKNKIFMRLLLVLLLSTAIFPESDEGDYLTSEEEILEALSREEISFTQYYDLIELFREKVDIFGDDIERLLLVPGVDERWIDAIRSTVGQIGVYASKANFIEAFPFDFERISAFVVFEQYRKGDFGGGARIYSHGKFIGESSPTSYYTITCRYKKSRLEFRFSDDRDSVRVRRRTIDFPALDGKFTIGSFHNGLGNGLIIGKHFHVPGAERKNSLGESFLSPYDNLFNGLRWSAKFSNIGAGALASRNIYDSVFIDALGAELSYSPAKKIRMGAVFGYGAVGKRPISSVYRQGAGSVFGSFDIAGNDIETELGFIDNGSAGFMLSNVRKFSKARTLLNFWAYEKDFNPLHSKGFSDYRETKIELLDETGIVHGSRQAGETGALLKISAPIFDALSFNTAQSGWATRAIGDWGILSQEGVYYRDSAGRRAMLDFTWEKRTLTTGVNLKETVRASFNTPLFRKMEFDGYFRLRWTTKTTSRTRSLTSYIEITNKHLEPFSLSLRIKRMKTNLAESENGYWEIRLRDSFKSGPILWTAEVRRAIYDKTTKDPLTEFRISAGYVWR